MKHAFQLVFGILFFISGCQSDAAAPSRSRAKKESSAAINKERSSDSKNNSSDVPSGDGDASVSGSDPVAAGSGSASGSSSAAELEPVAPADSVYPTLYYRGNGTIDAAVKGTQPISQALTVRLDQTQASIDTTENTSTDGEVNDGLQKGLGARVFTRVKPPENAKFAIFASQSTKGGVTTTYNPPIPVLILPSASATRYASLKGGAQLSYDTSASANGKTFRMTVTVKSTDSCSGASCTISIGAVAPDDADGQLYDLMGMSAETDFTVDFGTNRVTQLSTRTFYHIEKLAGPDGSLNPADMILSGQFPGPGMNDEMKKQMQEMSSKQAVAAQLGLCKVDEGGKVTSLGC